MAADNIVGPLLPGVFVQGNRGLLWHKSFPGWKGGPRCCVPDKIICRSREIEQQTFDIFLEFKGFAQHNSTNGKFSLTYLELLSNLSLSQNRSGYGCSHSDRKLNKNQAEERASVYTWGPTGQAGRQAGMCVSVPAQVQEQGHWWKGASVLRVAVTLCSWWNETPGRN